MAINVEVAALAVSPIRLSEDTSALMFSNLAKAGFEVLAYCGPSIDINVGAAVILQYISDSKTSIGILGGCINSLNLKPPLMVIRATRPHASWMTYKLLADAWIRFRGRFIAPSINGRGLSTPIIVPNGRILSDLIVLNRRFKLSSAMVKLMIKHRRDLMLVEVKDPCLTARFNERCLANTAPS